MAHENANDKNASSFGGIVDFVSRVFTMKIFIIVFFVTLGFAMTILSLIGVKVTPSTIFGESVERVVPLWYWGGVAIMIIAICYMLANLDARKLKIPFLVSCVMLIFSMRSVLAILSPYPPVQDTWGEIYINASWLKYSIFSPTGFAFFSGGYVRGWPASFILSYLVTYTGIPLYTFYKWAPTIIFVLDLVAIYFLFKELANEKIGMVAAFLFTLLNTNSFFPLHYSPQTLGALFYILAMYAIVKAYKTRKIKHLALALLGIFAVVFTHHMTTLFLGLSLAGAFLSKYFLALQQNVSKKSKLFSFSVKQDTFIKISLPLSVFTFVLWYFYGFIVYRKDAVWMLTEIMRLWTTHQPRYEAGYYYYYFIQSPLNQLSILLFPLFILGTTAIFLFGRVLKKEPLEGYLWLTMGWAGAMILTFIFGNLIYGNYVDPSRSREIITLALYPASASLLIGIFESKSIYKKGLITILLVIVAFLSVFSIYRGAQSIVYFEPPWWASYLIPP